jgi:hypothetical protein
MEMKGLKMFKLQESHVIEDLTMAINDNDELNFAMESHLWSLQRPALRQNLKDKLIHGNGDRKYDYPFASGLGIFLLQLKNFKANKCGHVFFTMPPISKCDLVMYFAWPLLLGKKQHLLVNVTCPKHDVIAKLDFQ